MKPRFTLPLSLSLAFTMSAFADTSTVPVLMSYQGRVTDAAGVLIGNTAPVNRTVTFRFYSSSSAATTAAIYAEAQTVTISAGEFSVLIGNGTGLTGSPGPSAPGTPVKTLSDVVNANTGITLYLGITVDDGNSSTVDTEITPRQQVVSAAYAMRSRIAEGVTAGSITSAMLGTSAVDVSQVAANAITSTKIADLTIAAADIANNTITAGKIDTGSIGLWTPTGANVYRTGNVGIGESNPGVALSFANVVGDKIALFGSNSTTKYGLGIQGSLLQIYSDAAGSDIALGYGNSASLTETMRVKGNGNVGIGTSQPSNKLQVVGGITSQSIRVDGGGGFSFNSPGDTDGGLFSPADGTLTFLTNGAERMRLDSAGRLGINSGNPAATLTVGPTLGGNAHSPVFTANAGSLSNTAGSEVKIASFGFASPNSSSLTVSGYRASEGAGWETGSILLSGNVDNSTRAISSYLSFGRSGIGINTVSPQVPLEVRGGSAPYYYNTDSAVTSNSKTYNQEGNPDTYSAHGTQYINGNPSLSMYADYGISAQFFLAHSDKRIKTIVDRSESGNDLKTINRLKVTDYQMKDKLATGNGLHKGLIAQEVREVMPEAVNKSTNFIPDIYAAATSVSASGKDEITISLAKPHGLKKGEVVRVYADGRMLEEKILESASETSFVIRSESSASEVFVYGRRVDDFLAVDYSQVFTTCIGGVQELSKLSNDKDKKIAELEARLSRLEKLVSTSAGK